MIIEKVRKAYLLLFLLLVIMTVYYGSLFAELLSVDDDALYNNLINLDDWSVKGLFIPGGGGYYYRPLLFLTFLADKFLWGPHESFMHLENVLLHGASCILVFFITAHLSSRHRLSSPAIPLVAALLFGLHPLATESVNWISGRTDLLAGFFLLIAMLLLVNSLARESAILLALAALSFFAATLAKETAVFWFPSILFFVYCYRREENSGMPCSSAPSPLWRRVTPYFLLSLVPIAYFVLRRMAYHGGDSGIKLAVQGAVGGGYDIMNKLRIAFKVFGFYLKKLVLPLPLNFAINSVSNWYIPLGIAGLLLCCYLLYRRSVLGALLLMSACIISPALLVPFGRMAWTPVAERYLYMPVAFFVTALVISGALLLRRWNVPANVVSLIVVALIAASGYATYNRNLVWQRNLTLFEDCVAKSPDFAPAKNELARALQNHGRADDANRLYRENTVSNDDKFRIVVAINRANMLAADNDIESAIALMKQLHYTKSEPMYDNYLKTMIFLYGKQEEQEKNRDKKHSLNLLQIDLMKELQSYTGDNYMLYRIGQLYLVAGDNRNAAVCFQMAADRAPAKAFYKEPARKLAARLSKSPKACDKEKAMHKSAS